MQKHEKGMQKVYRN